MSRLSSAKEFGSKLRLTDKLKKQTRREALTFGLGGALLSTALVGELFIV